MFFKISKIQGAVIVLLAAFIVILIYAYAVKSSASLVVALIEMIFIVILQYITFSEKSDKFISPGILAFYLLSIGVILYGMSLLHRSIKHKFGSVYQWWSALYFLLFMYNFIN